MASESAKFLDTTEAHTDIIEYKVSMAFTLSLGDDQVLMLPVQSFYSTNMLYPENRVPFE